MPNDYNSVRDVIVDAFTESEFGHNGECDIVDRLRINCDQLLSLVATENEKIVGHILFSPVLLRTSKNELQGMGLAPLAVAPARQNAGIGTALVESGLDQLSTNGCPFVVVLGYPQYYSRFRFQVCAQYGISHGFEGMAQDVFLVNILDRNAVQSVASGMANYRPEFGPQRDEDR